MALPTSLTLLATHLSCLTATKLAIRQAMRERLCAIVRLLGTITCSVNRSELTNCVGRQLVGHAVDNRYRAWFISPLVEVMTNVALLSSQVDQYTTVVEIFRTAYGGPASTLNDAMAAEVPHALLRIARGLHMK